MLPDLVGLEPAISWSPVWRTSDWADKIYNGLQLQYACMVLCSYSKGMHQRKRAITPYANSKGSDKRMYPQRFTRTYAVHSRKWFSKPRENFSQRIGHKALLWGQACTLKYWINGKSGHFFTTWLKKDEHNIFLFVKQLSTIDYSMFRSRRVFTHVHIESTTVLLYHLGWNHNYIHIFLCICSDYYFCDKHQQCEFSFKYLGTQCKF